MTYKSHMQRRGGTGVRRRDALGVNGSKCVVCLGVLGTSKAGIARHLNIPESNVYFHLHRSGVVISKVERRKIWERCAQCLAFVGFTRQQIADGLCLSYLTVANQLATNGVTVRRQRSKWRVRLKPQGFGSRGGKTVIAAQLCGIKPVSVSAHWVQNMAPRDPQCFWLWYLCRKNIPSKSRCPDLVRSKKKRVLTQSQKERLRERTRNFFATIHGKEKAKEYRRRFTFKRRAYEKQKAKDCPEFKIRRHLRARFAKVIKRVKAAKCDSPTRLAGCSIGELRAYLERQFKPDMNWQNHGTHWHIDHIRPIASFDLHNPEQQRAAFHFSNLQPLEAMENIRKGHRYDRNVDCK
jgi:hypothetical protein